MNATGGTGGHLSGQGARVDGDFYDFEKCDCRPKGLRDNAMRKVELVTRSRSASATKSETKTTTTSLEVGSLTALHYQRIFRQYDAILVPVKHTKPD